MNEMKHLVKWEAFENGVYQLKCLWCGMLLGESYVVNLEAGEFYFGDGSPCTVGVRVKDKIEAEDKLR